MMTVLVMVALGIGGSTLGMGEEFLPLVPICLLISQRLGYDRIFGLALVQLGASMGFAAATTNPFTVVIAQGIAELEPTSGAPFRMLFFAVVMSITIVYLLRYGARVKEDPANGLMADDDFDLSDQDVGEHQFNRRHLAILLSSVLIFAGILAATQVFGWWLNDMAGGFMLMGIVAAVIGGLSINETADAAARGMGEMIVAALVVGFARAIQVVLSDAMVLDTVIFWAASLLQQVPSFIAVQGMLLFQTVLNFLIPSGSGQAAVTMPLMVPLADVLGISRQTAVFAFQCGDGFSNTIVPTSGILMAELSLARIPYERWLRFVLPLFLILMATAAVFLGVAVAIGYS